MYNKLRQVLSAPCHERVYPTLARASWAGIVQGGRCFKEAERSKADCRRKGRGTIHDPMRGPGTTNVSRLLRWKGETIWTTPDEWVRSLGPKSVRGPEASSKQGFIADFRMMGRQR